MVFARAAGIGALEAIAPRQPSGGSTINDLPLA